MHHVSVPPKEETNVAACLHDKMKCKNAFHRKSKKEYERKKSISLKKGLTAFHIYRKGKNAFHIGKAKCI